MSFSQVFKADCSRWSLHLRTRQWNDLTSYRQSAFGGLIGDSTPLNYEYMAFDCVTFNIISARKSCFFFWAGESFPTHRLLLGLKKGTITT